MDDDDDFPEVDVDALVNAHNNRQGGTQPSSPHRVDAANVMAATGLPPRQGSGSGANVGGLLPPYSNPYQPAAHGASSSGGNAAAPGTAAAAPGCAAPYYGAPPTSQHPGAAGLPQPPPGQVNQQQNSAWTGIPGGPNGGPATVPPPYPIPHLAGGGTAGPGGMPPARMSGYGGPAPPAPGGGPSGSALQPFMASQQAPGTGGAGLYGGGVGAPPSKPRSLGQQLGFGAGGNMGGGVAGFGATKTAGNATFGGPYGGGGGGPYGGPYGGMPSGPSHVTGAFGPGAPGGRGMTQAGVHAGAAGSLATPGPAFGGPTQASAVAAAGAGAGTSPTTRADAAAGPGPNTAAAAAAAAAPATTNPGAPPLTAQPPSTATGGTSYWGTGGSGGGPGPPVGMDASRTYGGGAGSGAGGSGYAPQLGASGLGGVQAQQQHPYQQQPQQHYAGGGGGMGPAYGAGESEVLLLRRQLQDKDRQLRESQGAQQLTVHEKLELQELQRKHKELASRLQDERQRSEAAEREKKEALDKCLMLEAELHKSRAAGAAAAARTPPAKQPGGGGSSGVKRGRTTPLEPPHQYHPTGAYPLGHPLRQPHGQQAAMGRSSPLQQQQGADGEAPGLGGGEDGGGDGGLLDGGNQEPGRGGTGGGSGGDRGNGSATTGAQHQQQRPQPQPMPAATSYHSAGETLQPPPSAVARFLHQGHAQGPGGGAAAGGPAGSAATATLSHGTGGGGSGTAAGAVAAAAAAAAASGPTAAPPQAAAAPAVLLTALDGLRAAQLPLWQRLWCTCPDSLTALLHPTSAAAAAVAAVPGSGSVAAAAAAAAAAGLAPLHHASQPPGGARGGDGAGVYGSGADGSGSGGGGQGLLSGWARLLESVRGQLRSLAGGQGDGSGLAHAVLAFLQAAAWGLDRIGNNGPAAAAAVADGAEAAPTSPAGQGAGSPASPPACELHPRLPAPGAVPAGPQRAALRPLVGRHVALAAALLTHSEPCRAVVGASDMPPRQEPPAGAAGAADSAHLTLSLRGLQVSGGCLSRGGLPYLAAPLPSDRAAAAAAGAGNAQGHSCGSGGDLPAELQARSAAARELRRRQLRSYMYGENSCTESPGGVGGGGGDGGARDGEHGRAGKTGRSGPGVQGGSAAAAGSDGALADAACRWDVPGFVQLMLRLAELYGGEPEHATTGPIATAAAATGAGTTAVAQVDVLPYIAAALTAVGVALPAVSRRKALLPALCQPQLLLVPLLARTRESSAAGCDPRVTSRPATEPRVGAAALLHTLLESPACVAALAAALGVPVHGADEYDPGSGSRPKSGLEQHHNATPQACGGQRMEVDGETGTSGAQSPRAVSVAVHSYDSVMDAAAAVKLCTAVLEALEPDAWSEIAGGGGGGGAGVGSWGPYEVPRRVLALVALLLEAGHEGLVAALCCPPWLEGYGLPQRLLALADAAASVSGSDAPLEPVYPAPSNPALRIVAAGCVPQGEWLQRLRLAHEAMLLLKELITGGTEDMRRAALHDLTSTAAGSDTQHLLELATARLAAWPLVPPELLAPALARAASVPLAPWAARLALGGGGASRPLGGSRGAGGGSGAGPTAAVAASVEGVGALAGSVRRRWCYCMNQRQQQQEQAMLQEG